MMTGMDHVLILAPPGCEPSARQFFGDFLGLPELPKPTALAWRGGIWFALPDGRQLHIGVTQNFTPTDKGHVALRCTDLDELTERAAAHHIQLSPDTELAPLRRVFARDP